VRLLLALPLGLIIGLALGALGGGGSILAVPTLVYVVGLGTDEAVATSLVVVGVAALGGMVGHWRAGRVRVAAGLWFGLVGVVGSLLGTHLSQTVNPDVLLLAFAGVMLLVAWRMWATAVASGRTTSSASPASDAPAVAGAGGVTPADAPPPGRRIGSRLSTVGKVAAAGTAVGFMTGFFGVGGGFIIVPALVLALRFDMSVAIGTSLLVIFLNCGEALVSRLAMTGVAWQVALPFALAALIGAVAGNHMASRVRSSTLQRWFVVLLVAVAIYTLARSAVAL
jgi:uncharacterized membrane protein YfcA